jgi:hypothetical protein
MRLKVLLFAILLTSKAFGYQCEIIATNPKNNESQRIPVEIGKENKLEVKDNEYQCTVMSEVLKQREVTKINLTCIIPDTKLLSSTSAIIGLDFPSPANLNIRDRNASEVNFILACKK